MKQLYLFLLILFLTITPSNAQVLTIKSLKELPNDLSARTNARLDANDAPCALLKIQMTGKITKVEGNVVGDIVDHGTEKWVYLIDGTKQVKIIPDKYLPIMVTFAEHGLNSLKAKCTYQMELIAPQKGNGAKNNGNTPETKKIINEAREFYYGQNGKPRDYLQAFTLYKKAAPPSIQRGAAMCMRMFGNQI